MIRSAGVMMVLCLAAFSGICQQHIPARLTIYNASSAQHEAALSAFLDPIHNINFKNDRSLVHHIFKQAHKRFLKTYEGYSEFPALFSTGKYDCLTATAFFSLVLNDFQIRYSLIETNYHIFLLVHVAGGDILLETTDKYDGFITEPDKIQERIGSYQQNLVASSDTNGKQVYLYHLKLYRELSYTQLPGLFYFNQAIKAYNSKQWELCSELMDKAALIYDSPRMEELAAVLIQTVSENEKNTQLKRKIIGRAQRYLVMRSVAGL